MKKHQKLAPKSRAAMELSASKAFGEWLNFKRKEKLINQVFLAKELGTSQSRISKIEAGLLLPDLVDLLYLTKTFEIPEGTLFPEIQKWLETNNPA